MFLIIFFFLLTTHFAEAFSFSAMPPAPQPSTVIGESADTTNYRFFAESCECISPASKETDSNFTQSTNIVKWDAPSYNNGTCVCRVDIPSIGDYCVYPYYRGGGAFLIGLSDIRTYIPRFWSILPQRSSYGFNVDAINNLNLTPKKLNIGTSGVQNIYIQGSQDLRLGGIYLGRADAGGNCTAIPSLPGGSSPFTPDYTLQTISPIPTINGTFSGEDDWVNAVNFPESQTNNNTIQKATCLWNSTTNSIYCGFEILDADIQTGNANIFLRDRVEVGLCPGTATSTDCAKYVVDFLGNVTSSKWSGSSYSVTWTDGMVAGVTDITGGKRIEFSANLPTTFSSDQRGLIQFANPDREVGGTTVSLAFGIGNANDISQYGTLLASTTEPPPLPLDTTAPTYTSRSVSDETASAVTFNIVGVADDRATTINVVFRIGSATGLSDVGTFNTTIASGNTISRTWTGLAPGTDYFCGASLSDGINSTTVTELQCSTLSSNQFCVQSTGGSDANDGILDATPACWATLAKGVSAMSPGKTLVLMNSLGTGVWTEPLKIDCATNAVDGTAEQPITIKAENERQASIEGNGSVDTVRMDNCSYWTIEGLRAESADNPNSTKGNVFKVVNSSNIVLRRLLARNTNSYANAHTIAVGDSNNVLVEECEVYDFHRHGISIFKSSFSTVRRSYANSRGRTDPSGCTSTEGVGSGCSILRNRGDEGIVFYLSTDSVIENSISEGNYYIGDYGARNKILGSIALNNTHGLVGSHHSKFDFSSTDNAYIDNVTFKNNQQGIYSRSQERILVKNNTAIGNGSDGVKADNGRDPRHLSTATWEQISPSIEIKNTLALSNSNRGFVIINDTEFAYKILDYLNAFGNSTNYGSGTGGRTNSISTSPNMYDLATGQGCIVYVPDTSPMKSAGKDGEDIGANIIYRYENGVLTNEKLWNQVTGQFPCGATIVGINDDTTFPDSACINVHKRLNVGINGCPIP